ncbi:MAG: glycosyltransferase family 2 protein, partial [bacterium]
MISVVIGTYNQKETLKMVLVSLMNQSIPLEEYEIIVVDSSSTDGTAEMAGEFKVKYIRVENKGKSAARNKGIAEAKGEIILLTDADMIA